MILKFDFQQIDDLVAKARRKVEADFEQRLAVVAGQIKAQVGGELADIYNALQAALASGALYVMAEGDCLLAVISVRLEGHKAVLSFRQLSRFTEVLDLGEVAELILASGVAKISAQAANGGEQLVLENAGFRKVAVLQDELLIGGELRDTLLYERLSRERQEPAPTVQEPIEEEVLPPVPEEEASEDIPEPVPTKRRRLNEETNGIVSEDIQISKG